MDIIRTTHTGSLQRPEELRELLLASEEGQDVSAKLPEAVRAAVDNIVAKQVETGISVVSDGEMGKIGYSTYVTSRLTGYDGSVMTEPYTRADVEAFPDFAERMRGTGRYGPPVPACTGPITVQDHEAVQTDIKNLLAAAERAGIEKDRLFMTAASPGVIAYFHDNRYYASRTEYLDALSQAMSEEYRAIVEAGITLQLDCPDFAMSYASRFKDLSVQDFRKEVALAVEAVNAAVSGLPPEKMRVHLCWGNGERPHTHDVELKDIIDVVAGANVAGISAEAANPRHGHEWAVFEDVKLPDDKYILPGVIDTSTNFVEHPELVAQRLDNYVRSLGTERVVASTDCGFGTFVGPTSGRVTPLVTWAKLQSMVQGAEIASERARRRALAKGQ